MTIRAKKPGMYRSKFSTRVSPLILIVGIVGALAAEPRDWSILESRDTLAVLVGKRVVGQVVSATSVDSETMRITEHSSMAIEPPETITGFGAMSIEERRQYGADGYLWEADQKLTSPSGVSRWRLHKESGTGWQLSVTTGGVSRTRKVEGVSDNLFGTYAIAQGMKENTLQPGDSWPDTVFELTSATNMPVTTTCVSTPADSGYWVFTVENHAIGRSHRQVVDSAGRLVYEEIPPLFEAYRMDRIPNGEGVVAGKIDFSDFSRIHVGRKPRRNERVFIKVQSPASLPESVRDFYERSGEGWVLKPQENRCLSSGPQELDANLCEDYTAPTPIMQSDDTRIDSLAAALGKNTGETCDMVKALNAYVYRTIEKVNTTTFSSATETLISGFGDCGEHAVLLGALCRAQGIPARIVSGLLYMDTKQSYYYHAWVMVHDGHRWVFADPSHGEFPAGHGRLPLIVDDTGEGTIELSGLINRIEISYLTAESR